MIGVPRPSLFFAALLRMHCTGRKLKNKKIKAARLEARPRSIYLMSDVNTNVSDVGGRGLSKLEAFLCSACPSDYETENLLLGIRENGVFFFVCLCIYFVLFLG